MNTTLDVLDKALKGDPNALSYLSQTASIYFLDTATNSSEPRVYGCWDFFNQTLTEVERYEAQYGHYSHHPGEGLEAPHLMGQERPGPASLAPHVQMLTSLSRRAAQRPPATDRALVSTCLSNAAASGAYVGSAEQNSGLVQSAMKTRESLLGRIAALAFDFALHTSRGPSASSAFADPVVMEGFCTIVAANAVSSGPVGLHHLVADWIVPAASSDQLPRLSSAAVCAHLADEAMSNRSAPAGTSATLEVLFRPVLSSVVGPLLGEAVRDSDCNDSGDSNGKAPCGQSPTRNHRVAAMALRALERWCAATGAGIGKVKRACSENGFKVNIVEVISDTLYSDSEVVIDAAAELLETLLKKNAEDAASMQSFSLVNNFMKSAGANGLTVAEESVQRSGVEREAIISELVSAIGLQRFRFADSVQLEGNAAVCRCLARIASSVALASQSSIRSGKLGHSANGLLDLLLKGAAHPSIHVCGICLEAIPALIAPGSDYSDRLLPILQQRAIVPASLRGGQDIGDSAVDFNEYVSFRENLLSAALIACYKNNRVFFVESCTSAVHEFCAAPLTPQLPYQLEAALFCLGSVSIDASKRALLVNASPAAQQAAANASLTLGGAEILDIAIDARRHDEELAKCTDSIAKNPACATSNPLTLAQTCSFIAKYARWYSKTPSEGSLEAAAELALQSVNLAASADFAKDDSVREVTREMHVSPITEAANALRNILSRSPKRFATPQALGALETGWNASCVSANSHEDNIQIEDREAICSGLCRVLAALPSDQWISSLRVLAKPVVEYLEAVTKKADEERAKNSGKPDCAALKEMLGRMADEIKIIGAMVRTFRNAGAKSEDVNADPDSALVDVLHQAWPCLSHVSQSYGSNYIISSALSDLLTYAVVIRESGTEHPFFLEVCNMAANIMTAVASSTGSSEQQSTHAPIFHFVREAIEVHGPDAECFAYEIIKSSSPSVQKTHEIIDQLLLLSFKAIEIEASATWCPRQGQSQGAKRGEANPAPAVHLKKSSPDELAAIFDVLTSCMTKCPVLLVNLADSSSQDANTAFSRATRAAVVAINEKEIDVSRSAMMYLKTLFEIKTSAHEEAYALVGAVINSTTDQVRNEVVQSTVVGSCGVFLREVLDPAASLLSVALHTASPQDAEVAVTAALSQDAFKLGIQAKQALLVVLGKIAQEKIDSTVLMDVFEQIWDLHQGQDASSVAGGDAVDRFVKACGSI